MDCKIGFISLGCPKNQVDSELMLAKLAAEGFEITDTALGADVVIINTCGFIDAAKQEAIDNILEMAELKADGEIGKIIVTGCMAERYREEILKELPEVDCVAGIGCNGDIVSLVYRTLAGESPCEFKPKENMPLCRERLLTTPPYWAYLKIADGCSNCCSYCAIPEIRGPFRSRDKSEIVSEAKELAANGVRELILVAQDTTRYGEDLYGESALPSLLRELCKIEKLKWIRLLYCYPDRISDELLKTIRDNDKILNYIDLPLQHASGSILKLMNRSGDSDSLMALINKIRSYLPDCIIRSTFITGFPGETEEDFEILSDFVNKARLDRVGCFAYSLEEGTPAEKLPGRVDADVAEHRGEIIMEQQYRIFSEKQDEKIDKVLDCVVEDYDGYTDCYCGRAWTDAPEIDSVIYMTGKRNFEPGDFVKVIVNDTRDCDLLGEIIE